MNYSSLQFFFSEVYNSVKRNPLMAFASFSTMFFSIMVLGIFLLMIGNINFMTDYLISQVEVKVFLEDGISEKDVYEIKTGLTSNPSVESVHFVSKEEALRMLEKMLKRNIPVKKNTLLDSIEVSVKNPEDIDSVALEAQKLPGVSHVKYGKLELENLVKFSLIVRLAGAVLTLLLVIITIVIVSNTIRLTIFARSREIEIMQLVGATRWFIKWPFILEGFFYGFSASFISVIILFIFYYIFADFFSSNIHFIGIISPFSFFSFLSFFILLITGIFMGIFASLFSVNRFLKI